ncbi:MAG: GGDEF domain-containing protein [Deltaproteobacteria bacterium]|nr:GGDEF domain-containing protein [Deltaproteobacteria bacterium]
MRLVRGRRKTEELDLSQEIGRLKAENAALHEELVELRQLREAAYRDPVTGLRNRRYFEERLQEELGRLARYPDKTGSLLVVDLDDFKQINDTHGHLMGDQILREVAELMSQTLRLEDVCCRFGGDEFAVILPETSGDAVEHVVSRIMRALDERNLNTSLPLFLSVGAASWPEAGRDAGSLIEKADTSMYSRKREGKRARTPVPPPLDAPPRLSLV